jgi:hypothetical protein
MTVEKAEPGGFAPTEDWIAAFEAQATDELYEKATRYATSRAWGVAKARGTDDDLYVLELVQDAFTDTLAGVIAWTPELCSLELHIINAIRGRSRHDREHAFKYRRESLDDRRDHGDIEQAAVRDLVEGVLTELRELAKSDRDVLRMLDGFASGAYTKEEIMTATEMSAKTYRNARIRLARLVKQLQPEAARIARVRA